MHFFLILPVKMAGKCQKQMVFGLRQAALHDFLHFADPVLEGVAVDEQSLCRLIQDKVVVCKAEQRVQIRRAETGIVLFQGEEAAVEPGRAGRGFPDGPAEHDVCGEVCIKSQEKVFFAGNFLKKTRLKITFPEGFLGFAEAADGAGEAGLLKERGEFVREDCIGSSPVRKQKNNVILIGKGVASGDDCLQPSADPVVDIPLPERV